MERKVTAGPWHSGGYHRRQIACPDVLNVLDLYKVQSGSCRRLRECNTASLNDLSIVVNSLVPRPLPPVEGRSGD